MTPSIRELELHIRKGLKPRNPVAVLQRIISPAEVMARAQARSTTARKGAFPFERFHNGGPKGPKSTPRKI